MKKKIVLFSAFLAASCLTYTSCNKVQSLINAITVDWTSTDVDFVVPINTNTTAQQSIGTGSYTYDLDSLIRNKSSNELGLENIDEVYLAKCTITINDADAANNLANFENADASFSTTTNTTNTPIGSVSIPDVYANTIEVPVNKDVNLRSYVSSTGTTTFNYNVSGKARRATTKELHATVHVEYSIHVKP